MSSTLVFGRLLHLDVIHKWNGPASQEGSCVVGRGQVHDTVLGFEELVTLEGSHGGVRNLIQVSLARLH